MFPFKIKFKPSFFIVTAFSFYLGLGKYYFVLFFLLVLHEFCHIFTAGIWGLKTNIITFSALGVAAEIAGLEQLHIIKRIIISAAGPLFNLTLWLLCTNKTAALLNLALALFNLLPIYPLDGGKIFHYILSYFIGVLRGNIIAVKINLVVSGFIIIAGIVQLVLYPPNLSLLCLGIYFYRLNRNNIINLTYRFYKSVINKDDNKIMPVRSISVSRKMEIKAIIYRLGWDYYSMIYVRDGNEICAVLNEEKLLEFVINKGLKGIAEDAL